MRELNWFLEHGMGQHTQETLDNVLDLRFIVPAIANVSNNKEAARLSEAITNLRAQRL